MASTAVEPKRGAQVERVVVDVTVRNQDDVRRSERDELPRDQVRSLTVHALVDFGATFFCLPASAIQTLRLPFNRDRETLAVTGPLTLRGFGGARIEVYGRCCDAEVMELPDTGRPLLGQIPLRTLDFWIDVTNQELVGNPEHGGQWMAEVF